MYALKSGARKEPLACRPQVREPGRSGDEDPGVELSGYAIVVDDFESAPYVGYVLRLVEQNVAMSGYDVAQAAKIAGEDLPWNGEFFPGDTEW